MKSSQRWVRSCRQRWIVNHVTIPYEIYVYPGDFSKSYVITAPIHDAAVSMMDFTLGKKGSIMDIHYIIMDIDYIIAQIESHTQLTF